MEKTKAITKYKNEMQKVQTNSKNQSFHNCVEDPKKKAYKKICFNNIIYEVGETLLFRETENTTVVGKLVRIIPEGGNL